MNKRYYTIELIRFLSCVAVLFYHYKIGFAWDKGYVETEKLSGILPFYDYINLLYNDGLYGLQMFFLISGFVFAHIYINKTQLIGAKEFFFNRFARLYPLHFLTLLLFVLFYLIDQDFVKSQLNVERNRFIDLYHFILNIFFIQSWGFEKGLSFNAPTWSVSLEIGIYITFFLSLRLFRKYKLFFSIIAVSLLYLLYKNSFLHFKYSEFVLLYYIGVLTYQLPIKNHSRTFIVISILFVLASFYGRNFKILLFAPGILILSVILDNYIGNFRIKNLFSILGASTYAMYLFHYPFMLIFLWMENKYHFFLNFYENNFFIFFYFFSLILLSIFSFYKFESPLNKKIRKVFLK